MAGISEVLSQSKEFLDTYDSSGQKVPELSVIEQLYVGVEISVPDQRQMELFQLLANTQAGLEPDIRKRAFFQLGGVLAARGYWETRLAAEGVDPALAACGQERLRRIKAQLKVIKKWAKGLEDNLSPTQQETPQSPWHFSSQSE